MHGVDWLEQAGTTPVSYTGIANPDTSPHACSMGMHAS